jgi:hypothetical protein
MALERVRDKHPTRVPCLVSLPDGLQMKLLFDKDDTVGHLMHVVRDRWVDGTLTEYEALFALCGSRMCTATTRLVSLDTAAPDPVHLHIRRETTFGE